MVRRLGPDSEAFELDAFLTRTERGEMTSTLRYIHSFIHLFIVTIVMTMLMVMMTVNGDGDGDMEVNGDSDGAGEW